MATAVETLTSRKSLGNIRPLSSIIRAKHPPAADATTGLQDQMDSLLGLTKNAVAELQSISVVTPTSNSFKLSYIP